MENKNNFELVTELLSKFYHKTEIEICIAISEKNSLHLFVEKFNKVPLPEVKKFIFHCVLIDEFEIAIEFMTLLIPKSVFPDNPPYPYGAGAYPYCRPYPSYYGPMMSDPNAPMMAFDP